MAASDHASRPPGASPTSGVPPPLETRWKPGQSGNPSGLPKLTRPVTVALVELQETPGSDRDEIIENFKEARRKAGGLIAADLKAIRAFIREWSDEAVGVSQHNATLDRLEGKVAQRIEVGADADTMAAIAAAAKAART